MYDHFELQMRYAREQGHRVDLATLTRRDAVRDLTEEDVTAFLGAQGMMDICHRLTPAGILIACRNVTNPYVD
jgi:hypothetical protein